MAFQITDKSAAQPTAASEPDKLVVTGLSTPTSTSNSTRFFDFFGLPRELRDKIYEQPVLFEYEHLSTNSENGLITKAKKLRTSLLRVSRQFRDEYTETCTGQEALCIRDHCKIWGRKAVLPSPNRARSWAIEFFVLAGGNIGDDLQMLKYFLNLQAGPDLALRSINIKLLFEDTPREEIESVITRRAISEVQVCEKVASLELYLAEKAWDYRRSGKAKILIARWDRSDDLHIDFSMPAVEFHDIGSEWGHPDDIDPDCCGSNKQ
jgi:hypothetical protein